jgi:predicted ATPase
MVGRQPEVQALLRALQARHSRLILGATGIGKTRLLDEALSQFREPYLLVSAPAVLHELLVHLAEGLRCRIDRCSALHKATSVSLKGAVLETLKARPLPILLEDVEHADPRMYRFLQEIYHLPGNCLTVTARSRDCLGYLRKLLWDPREEIALGPLTRREGEHLFEAASSVYKLRSLGLQEFRRKVLESARGNPGQILAMCRLAVRPQYRAGDRIKFLPLRMDVLPTFVR